MKKTHTKLPITIVLFPWGTVASVLIIAGSENLLCLLCISALAISCKDLVFPLLQQNPSHVCRVLYIFVPAIICSIAFIRAPQEISSGMPLAQIREVTGVIVSDSVKTGNRGMFFKLKVTETYDDRTQTRCSAKGEVPVIISNSEEFYYRGETVICKGVFSVSSDLWFVREVMRFEPSGEITDIIRWHSLLLNMRLFFIKHIRGRIQSAGGETAKLLEMILLGLVDSPNMPLKEVCKKAGCAHILALSGMHIQILALCISVLFTVFHRRNKEGYATACVVVIFVIIAGCKASLVRAAINYILILGYKKSYRWNSREGFFFQTLFLQMVLFPWTMGELSAVLSYTALAGILFISPEIEFLAPAWIPTFLVKALAASIGAVLATLPITGKYFGAVYVIGIIASPIMAVLITIFMAAGLLYIGLFFLPAKLLIRFLEKNYQLISETASFFSRFPYMQITGGMQSKIVYFEIILLTVMFSIQYATAVSQKKRLKAYELGVPLRFSGGNCTITGTEWSEDDKKIRPEFSYSGSSQGADYSGNSV